MPSSFVVLSVLIDDEDDAENVKHVVSLIPSLIVHEHAIRRPGELDAEYTEDEDEEERIQTRVLLSCSIDGQCNEGRIHEMLSAAGRRVSLWCVSPCLVPLFKLKLEDLIIQSEEEAVSVMQENGLFVIRGAVDVEVVEEVLSLANSRIAQVERLIQIHHPKIRLGSDLFAFQEAASRGIHRFDVLFEERDPQFAMIFTLSQNAPWVPYVQKLLRTSDLHVLCSVVYSDPGSEDQEWHSDGPHQGQDCYAVCVFAPLCDLDQRVGFTQFYPGSHRHQDLLGMGGAALATGSSIDAIFSRGDAILYDYRTIHRGIGNRSKGTRRPLLQLVYHTKHYKEARNYGQESLHKS